MRKRTTSAAVRFSGRDVHGGRGPFDDDLALGNGGVGRRVGRPVDRLQFLTDPTTTTPSTTLGPLGAAASGRTAAGTTTAAGTGAGDRRTGTTAAAHPCRAAGCHRDDRGAGRHRDGRRDGPEAHHRGHRCRAGAGSACRSGRWAGAAGAARPCRCRTPAAPRRRPPWAAEAAAAGAAAGGGVGGRTRSLAGRRRGRGRRLDGTGRAAAATGAHDALGGLSRRGDRGLGGGAGASGSGAGSGSGAAAGSGASTTSAAGASRRRRARARRPARPPGPRAPAPRPWARPSSSAAAFLVLTGGFLGLASSTGAASSGAGGLDQAVLLGPTADAVGLRLDDGGRVAARADAQLVAEVEDLLVAHAELAWRVRRPLRSMPPGCVSPFVDSDGRLPGRAPDHAPPRHRRPRPALAGPGQRPRAAGRRRSTRLMIGTATRPGREV